MTAVMVEMTATRTEEDDEISFIDDMDAFGVATVPGCGDDNPYQ
ncbi:hypothetical protein [Kitasatospora sp. NPDC059327]